MMRWFPAAFLFLVATDCGAQSACQRATVSRLAANVTRIDSALRAVRVGDAETDVPKPVQGLIIEFKDALAAVVDAEVLCSASGSSAADLQVLLANTLNANRPERPFNPATEREDYGYGTQLTVAVSTPSNAPQLRMVEVDFGIECDEDSVLMLYEAGSTGWRRLMRWQTTPYAKISGAMGDGVYYAVMPAQGATPLRVVVAHGTPWCSSRFSQFAIDLLQPAPSGERPLVKWRTERGYSRGDAETRLRATSDIFELRTNVVAMNIDDYETPVVFRFKIAGDTVTRIEPIALNGRGFVEEWLGMPWDEARDQVNPASVGSLKPIHDQFATPFKESDKSFLDHRNGPVRVCKGADPEFQVEIENTRETFVEGVAGGRTETLPSWFFRIRETGDGYEMESVGNRADPDCNGPNLMPAKR